MGLMLYYDSKSNRLVKEDSVARGSYIEEHDKKGYKHKLAKQELEIPESNVKIVVETNLDYGRASFMRATLNQNDRTILNFFDTNLSRSVCYVSAKPKEWSAFFDDIIKTYNNIHNVENYANKYFDAIKDTLNETIVLNKITAMMISKRLAEIVENLPESIYFDNILINARIKEVIVLLLQRIMTDGPNLIVDKSDRQEVESNLHVIFSYLSNRDEMLSALEEVIIPEKDKI